MLVQRLRRWATLGVHVRLLFAGDSLIVSDSHRGETLGLSEAGEGI